MATVSQNTSPGPADDYGIGKDGFTGQDTDKDIGQQEAAIAENNDPYSVERVEKVYRYSKLPLSYLPIGALTNKLIKQTRPTHHSSVLDTLFSVLGYSLKYWSCANYEQGRGTRPHVGSSTFRQGHIDGSGPVLCLLCDI